MGRKTFLVRQNVPFGIRTTMCSVNDNVIATTKFCT